MRREREPHYIPELYRFTGVSIYRAHPENSTISSNFRAISAFRIPFHNQTGKFAEKLRELSGNFLSPGKRGCGFGTFLNFRNDYDRD